MYNKQDTGSGQPPLYQRISRGAAIVPALGIVALVGGCGEDSKPPYHGRVKGEMVTKLEEGGHYTLRLRIQNEVPDLGLPNSSEPVVIVKISGIPKPYSEILKECLEPPLYAKITGGLTHCTVDMEFYGAKEQGVNKPFKGYGPEIYGVTSKTPVGQLGEKGKELGKELVDKSKGLVDKGKEVGGTWIQRGLDWLRR
ncbi:MAG: hypothetical protein AABX33_06070 [Nanoarchaeota archaeon]